MWSRHSVASKQSKFPAVVVAISVAKKKGKMLLEF
jgi:hypothetical protein